MDIFNIIGEFRNNYAVNTPSLLKVIDVFLAYILLTGVIQFVYCALVGTFPFNSFLSGFISTVGSFILTGMLS
jgi:oligosaccharyltransferase complex subunit epsilon